MKRLDRLGELAGYLPPLFFTLVSCVTKTIILTDRGERYQDFTRTECAEASGREKRRGVLSREVSHEAS